MHHPRRVGGLFGRAGSVAVAVAAAAVLAACSGPGSSAPDDLRGGRPGVGQHQHRVRAGFADAV